MTALRDLRAKAKHHYPYTVTLSRDRALAPDPNKVDTTRFGQFMRLPDGDGNNVWHFETARAAALFRHTYAKALV